MPERFRITYDRMTTDPARSMRLFHFSVAVGERPRSYVTVAVPVVTDIDDPDVFPEVALDRLELELRAVGSGLFAEEERITEISLRRQEVEQLASSRSGQKACVWQERGQREWNCLAHVGEGEPATGPALCEGCQMPDERVVCAHLMKPGIALRVKPGAAMARVLMRLPGCTKGNDPEGGKNCRLAGKECWERLVDTHISSPLEPPPDIPRSTADELDFLRLVVRDRLQVKDAVPVPQARSISELFGRCDSAENLQRRLATIGDLLNRLDFVDALDPADQRDERGEKLKSLGALQKLLDLAAPEASGAVSTLRSIVKVRNTFPVHTQAGKTSESFRELGIDYPPSDWHAAWTSILTSLWASIRRIREALQTTEA